MEYAWLIDFDHLDNKPCHVSGPRGANPELLASLKNGEGKKFKMYDDDGELYFSGRIVGEFEGLEPLDDYGMPACGATEIRYNGVPL